MRSLSETVIRPAVREDAPAVGRIIRRVAHHFTHLHPRAVDGFLLALTPEAIARRITSPRYMYMVSMSRCVVSGVVGLRDCTHLLHLFVDPRFQRQGVGRRLWDEIKDQALLFGNTHGFTVNATSFAVPVYERFGFRPSGPRIETDGIAYTPMRLTLPL